MRKRSSASLSSELHVGRLNASSERRPPIHREASLHRPHGGDQLWEKFVKYSRIFAENVDGSQGSIHSAHLLSAGQRHPLIPEHFDTLGTVLAQSVPRSRTVRSIKHFQDMRLPSVHGGGQLPLSHQTHFSS